MCSVSAYAPTETGSSVGDIEEFYSDLRGALAEARGSVGGDDVVIMGDFNIHLGDDYRGMGHPSLGECLPPGPSSRNSQYLVAFCDSEKLSQTFQNRGKVEGRDSLATWCHPGSGKLHLKDFILIPKGEVQRVHCWPAPEIEVGTDHNLVICQPYCREGAVVAALQRAAKRGVDQGSGSVQKVPRVSDRVELRKLDTAPAPERVREYVAQLGDGLRGKPGNWKVTEKVMIEAAIKTLPTAQKPEEMTWRTAEAQRELR
jgi:hypothetical protein